jgi:hypothetical protein
VAKPLGDGDPRVPRRRGPRSWARFGPLRTTADRRRDRDRERSREPPLTLRNCEEPNFSFDLTGTSESRVDAVVESQRGSAELT